MASLPTPGGDSGTWGTMLNSFLEVALVQSGTYAGSFTFVSTQTHSTAPSGSPYLITTGSNASYTTGGETVLCDASGGNVYIKLPDATSLNAYTVHNIKKIDSSTNMITISTTSSQTIDGGSSAVIQVQYVSITVVSNGSNWSVI